MKDKDLCTVCWQTSEGKCVSIYRVQEKGREFGAVKSSVSPDFVTYWLYDLKLLGFLI